MYNTRVHVTSDVIIWLPWNNTPLRHRYGYHGITPHPNVIAIYSISRPDNGEL